MLLVGTLMTMTIEELLLLSFDNYFIVKWFKCNPSRKKHGWCMRPKAGIDTMISLFKLILPVFIWFLWEGFSSWLPISRYCLLWLMPHGFGQSHIRERRLPHVPYKFEFKTHVYHYYTCVVVVEACLALTCWQQNCAGVKPILATRQALGLKWKSPKRTILEMGTALKSAF